MQEQSCITKTEPSGSLHPSRAVRRIRKRDGTLVPFDQERITQAVFKAMLAVETDQHEPNQVLEEFQKGYRLNDRLLRPATVSVSKLPVKEAQAS